METYNVFMIDPITYIIVTVVIWPASEPLPAEFAGFICKPAVDGVWVGWMYDPLSDTYTDVRPPEEPWM